MTLLHEKTRTPWRRPLHPRRLFLHRYWERARERAKRMAPGVRSFYRLKFTPPLWMDYFPDVYGTMPEKMVFAELVRRGISFFFSPYWGDMPFTYKWEHYRPDFLLPEYRIIIEVVGVYWHGVKGSYERDAMRAALYTASGYTIYQLWDKDVLENVMEAVDQVPELRNPSITTGRQVLPRKQTNAAASLRAQARTGPRVVRERWKLPGKVRKRDRVKPLAAYLPSGVEPEVIEPYAVRFYGFPEWYLQQLREYSQEWRDYMAKLHKHRKKLRGDQRRYYLLWWGWWDKWQKRFEQAD